MSVEMREAALKGARSTVRRLDVGRAAAATRIRTASERLPRNTIHGDAFPVWRQSRSRFSKAGTRECHSARSLTRTLNIEDQQGA